MSPKGVVVLVQVTGGGRGGRPGGQCLGAADSAGNKATGDNVKCASGVCTAAVGLRGKNHASAAFRGDLCL